MTLTLTTFDPFTTVFAGPMPPQGEDSVGVSVEITPNDTSCTTACPTEDPVAPTLPVTGGEPVSILLPAALLLAGIVATVWSRWKTERS